MFNLLVLVQYFNVQHLILLYQLWFFLLHRILLSMKFDTFNEVIYRWQWFTDHALDGLKWTSYFGDIISIFGPVFIFDLLTLRGRFQSSDNIRARKCAFHDRSRFHASHKLIALCLCHDFNMVKSEFHHHHVILETRSLLCCILVCLHHLVELQLR